MRWSITLDKHTWPLIFGMPILVLILFVAMKLVVLPSLTAQTSQPASVPTTQAATAPAQ